MKLPLPPVAAGPAADHDDSLPDFLRNRPRRSPLSAPPPGYFDELPVRLLTRIRAEAPRPAPALLPAFDLSRLRWPRLRMAFTSAALGAAFVAAFWLGQPQLATPGALEPSLAGVQTAELVAYLADPAAPRLTAADLSTTSAADLPAAAESLAVPTGDDLDAALDELPLDESYL